MFQELQDCIILGNMDLKRTNLAIEGYGKKYLNYRVVLTLQVGYREPNVFPKMDSPSFECGGWVAKSCLTLANPWAL